MNTKKDDRQPQHPPSIPPDGSPGWCPMLRAGDLQISLYADETLEIRDGQAVYVHLTPEETASMLRWLDAREKAPKDKLNGGEKTKDV